MIRLLVLLFVLAFVNANGPVLPTNAPGQTTKICAKKVDAVFVLDTSGSVDAKELVMMKDAVKVAVNNLGSTSKFSVTESFGGNTKPYWGSHVLETLSGQTDTRTRDQLAKLPKIPTPPELQAGIISQLDAVKQRAAATDLVEGLSRATELLIDVVSNTKVLFVLFDGATNVYDPKDSRMPFARVKAAIQKAQANGIWVFFLGIGTGDFRKLQQTHVEQCVSANTALKASTIDWDDERIKGCVTSRYNSYLREAREGNAASISLLKKVAAKSQAFHEDQVAQIDMMKTELEPRLQYLDAGNFDKLKDSVRSMVGKICDVLVPNIHFDSSKWVAPCTNTFFPCSTEVATAIEQLKSCPVDQVIHIGGHTSLSGTASGNLALSKQRCRHVKAILEAEFPQHKMVMGAYGANNMAVDSDSGKESTRAAAQNRRVTLSCGTPTASLGWDSSSEFQ